MKQDHVIRASEIKPGDFVESWYDPKAERRRPAGWRVGDPETFGRFKGFRNHPEGFIVECVTKHDRPGVLVFTPAVINKNVLLRHDTKVTVWR